MENRKQEFIQWVSANKLKKTSPEEFGDLIERVFFRILNINVWTITSQDEFSALHKKVLADKGFKKTNKRDYKLLAEYSKYYFIFLKFTKNMEEERISKLKGKDYNHESTVSTQTGFKYEKERNLCIDFFSDSVIGTAFYRLFEHSKNIESSILLDVRTAIIGVKKENERLRYYADKNAILKFSKIDLDPINLKYLSAESLNECFRRIDAVNSYFSTHKSEVSLSRGSKQGYIYHKVFGFGKIMSREGSILYVQFDGMTEIKRMQAGHPSFVEISADEYSRGMLTIDDSGSLIPPNNDSDVQPKRIFWDKYETALLIEAFWKIENKTASVEVISDLSTALRKKARNQGLDIDDTFRNENGIRMQLSNIAKVFFPDRPAMHRTAVFDEMAEIYKTDKKQFDKLLNEAHELVEGNTIKKESKKVDWADLRDMSYSSPLSVTYKGERRTDFNSWVDCYGNVLRSMYKDEPKEFLNLAKEPSYTFLSQDKTDLRRPLEIAEYIYAEGNKSATELVRSIKTFIDKFDFKYSDIVIEYVDSKSKSTDACRGTPEIKYAGAITETDFNSFMKQRYLEKHKSDGKAHRAPRHAQKCVDMIRAIGKLLNINLFVITKTSEVSDVRAKLSEHKNDIDYGWYIYALNKFEDFISKESINADDYKTVLSDSFVDGFYFENPLRKKRFIRRYEELLNREFNDSEEAYLRKISLAGFISESKVYLESIVDAELKSDIKSFIDNGLQHNSAVYYSSLYQAFNGRFNSLFSEDMLKNYLKFVFSSDYNFSSEYMTRIGTQVDLRKELIDVFMNSGRSMDIEEIYASMPNISHDAIDEILKDKDFIVNCRGKSYFYKDVFIIEDVQLEQIDRFLSKQLATKEQIAVSELYSFISMTMPDILESNPGVTDYGRKGILKLKLENKYKFGGNIITTLDQAIDVKTLYRDFCNQREGFSFSELEEFRNSINQSHINWDYVMLSSVRISQSSFIRRDLVTFNVEQIDKAVADYCPRDYASFVDVINYTDFPTMEVNWNVFVLESYLYMNSPKFKLVHSTFNGDKPVGAIVNKNSDISCMEDLLVAIIKDKQLFDQEKAYAYLLENDYIKTRKVKDIELLIDRAKKEV